MIKLLRAIPLILFALLVVLGVSAEPVSALPANPIVFVTQPPNPQGFATVNATFGNHLASMDAIPRGGDLYIRYANRTLKNLTQAAGYGVQGMQGATAIAVRDPSVHWDGTKVIFSMVIGAPTQRYQVLNFRWQIYEITGLGVTQTPVITKLANQPSAYNNVSPIYGTDDRIIFTSDRPRSGEAHLYPQRDEYESSATNTGLWSLDPTTADLRHLDHAPSGDFNPLIDSVGRVVFTRWDHLQRDQQNRCSNAGFQAFNYSSESADASVLDSDAEVFPEPRGACEDDLADNLDTHSFNHFLPWQINEDGSEMETLNHIGRHELASYLPKSFNDDANVVEYYGQYSRLNQVSVNNFFQISEDPANPGMFFGTSAPEFGTHASGQIVKLSGAISLRANQMQVTAVTHPDTANTDSTPSADHIGLSRDPAPLSDGTLIASTTAATQEDSNVGSSAAPESRYGYLIKPFSQVGGYFRPGTSLTGGIQKTISFWSPDLLVSYNNVTMWELQPRELVERVRPAARSAQLPEIEASIFADMGVSVQELKDYLRANSLALVISRDLTSRDAQDRQQPRNLRVADSTTEAIPNGGKIYDIAHVQFFQGDQVRAYAASNSSAGRRVIAQEMHDITANPGNPSGPSGSVKIASDGSMAAFVPATRALTYQVTDAQGQGVVRERLWLTFQPGEIRVCASCHGVNSQDQIGRGEPTNPPEALRLLLEHWSSVPHESATFDLRSVRSVKGGESSSLNVTGNSIAASKPLSLRLKVNNKECGVVRSFSLNAQSSYSRSYKAPKARKNAVLRWRLIYAGTVKDTSSTTLLRVAARSARKYSNTALCAAVKRALR